MNKPDIYYKSHRTAKVDVGDMFREFSKKIQWRPEGGDVLCDVGTGPGDVFANHIYPLVKEKCAKIILSDISSKMLDYCRNILQASENFDYEILDISAHDKLPTKLLGQVDHVTSMLVMHWISNHRQALRNIYNLLRPEGGDFIVTFFSYSNFFEACYQLANSSKWLPYTNGKGQFIMNFQNSKNTEEDFRIMMESVGFRNVEVKMKSVLYDYGNKDIFKESMISICPTLNFIPISHQDDFLNDMVSSTAEFASTKLGINMERAKYLFTNNLIVAYGQKLRQL
ncbi:juvenile hormone acid O-methyltransferase-like [Haematobia irritans]|uniref:juvenile hormone acid O-methyltransferase-like n=1 Tax=Haematobia irritans TaxID=7368 RepID=UPI003F505E1E